MPTSRSEVLQKQDRKIERVLGLWNILSHGRSVSKAEVAELYHVDGRTVSRYFKDLRDYLEQLEKSDGIKRELIYDTVEKKYRIRELENRYISNGELFGICKILLASRAFHKKEMTSLMERLLQTAVPMKEKEIIKDYIKKELFAYQNPKHKIPDMDAFWKLTQAVDHHHVLTFNYQKIGALRSTLHRVKPLGVFFSEYYFYLVASDTQGDEQDITKSYCLDRMSQLEETEEIFDVPYTARFQEGKYKNRIQYMIGGKEIHLTFLFKGKSIEAVLDRLPTAKATKQPDGNWHVEADVQGEGILMWLLSQGSRVEVLSPEKLRQDWLDEARRICEMGNSGE